MSERPQRWNLRTVGGTDSAPDPSAGPRIAILLSLYDGEAFLNAQLDSFLAQSHRNWVLLWRDDSSDDASVAIMHSFQAHRGAGRCIEIDDVPGNLGVAESYALLLERAPADAFIAFADQDDVWFPDKLERAIDALPQDDVPALYCARQHLTDRTLAPTAMSPEVPHPPGFATALTQNIATGCTIVLTPAARALIAPFAPPEGTLHDWWSYLLVSAAGGRIIFDSTPVLFYRQHGGNSVGARPGLIARARHALRRGPRAFMDKFSANVGALADPDLPLSDPARALVTALQGSLQRGWRDRLAILRHHPALRRQTWLETQVFRLWFLLGP